MLLPDRRILRSKGGRIMSMPDDTLNTERDDEIEELLAEADDPGPGDWLRDLEAIEREYQSGAGA